MVDIVELRAGGRKLPKAQVERADPKRGHLAIRSHQNKDASRIADGLVTAAVFVVGLRTMGLDQARVTKMDGDSFVIVGLEAGEAMYQQQAQAWWCRVVR